MEEKAETHAKYLKIILGVVILVLIVGVLTFIGVNNLKSPTGKPTDGGEPEPTDTTNSEPTGEEVCTSPSPESEPIVPAAGVSCPSLGEYDCTNTVGCCWAYKVNINGGCEDKGERKAKCQGDTTCTGCSRKECAKKNPTCKVVCVT